MPSKPMDYKMRIAQSTAINTDSGCWEWTKKRDRVGYGRVQIQLGRRGLYRMTSAHRFAYEVFVGEIPKGMNVLHRCDNRACCNPDHLFIGTQQDNMRDMHAKGRGPRGYKRSAIACSENARKKRSHRNQYSAAIASGGEDRK